MAKYDASSIETHKGLDYIRTRPTFYVENRGVEGQVHTLWEILSNSVDEIAPKTEGGSIWVGLLFNHKNNKYQIFILDTGRGIPADKLKDTQTEPGTSGKMNSDAYGASAGMFGVGAKVAVALSNKFRAITSNYLEKNRIGSIYLEDGVIKDHHDEAIELPSGMLSVCELDVDQFFGGGAEFIGSGYMDLVNHCKKINIFNPGIDFNVFSCNRFLPEAFWTADAFTATEIIRDFITNKPKEVLYASSITPDKSAYLFDMWKINSNLIYSDIFHKDPLTINDRLAFDIKLFFTKKSATAYTQYFISVNNVDLVDKTENSVTTTFLKHMRKRIVSYLNPADEKEAHLIKFVQEDYRFPTMCLAIGVLYSKTELAGATKNSFKNSEFSKEFGNQIERIFDERGTEYWMRFVELLKPDIQTRYSQTYDTASTKSADRRVFINLNNPNNYHECKGNTDHNELYIVEGRSAGNITATRDNNFQAIYETRGKPLNVASCYDKIGENRKLLMKDPLYQDLMTILNITPASTDMSNARFKKIIIATDADPDGYHIASLHLNNFYVLNPKIIESGMMWLSNPPLYSMNLSKNNRLFLRDKTALHDARIRFIYRDSLSITALTDAGETLLDKDEGLYREMCYLIDYIGGEFKQVADQLNIPILILERLVLGIRSIYPKTDYTSLALWFNSSDPAGYIRVIPDPVGRFIVVSEGDKDYAIGLDVIGPTIRDHLIPLTIKYKVDRLMFRVSSLHQGSTIRNALMSPMMLYIALQGLNSLFKVSRYKGLGQMPPESCDATIMNPETRSMTQITSIGDPLFNYALVGKSDTVTRKQLLNSSSALSDMFIKQNGINS